MNKEQYENLKNREECTLSNGIYICSKMNIIYNVPMFKYKNIWFYIHKNQPTSPEDLELAFNQTISKNMLQEIFNILTSPDELTPQITNYVALCSVWKCMNYENPELF